MGYNTTVFILNDRLGDIERNPEKFVQQMVDAVHEPGFYVMGQTVVMPTAHADQFRLYATQANSIVELSKYGHAPRGDRPHPSPSQRKFLRTKIDQALRELDSLRRYLNDLDAVFPND